VQIKLSNKEQGIFVFQLDQNNYIKFCPERGGLITNWVSDGKEILYFDEKRFIDKTKSVRGGIPILFPICGNLDALNSVFGEDYLQLNNMVSQGICNGNTRLIKIKNLYAYY